ncbi:hypothetical protein AB0K71_06000 [Streptomyces syringium]|uniref:hypothetical protein n=1 Tax=Streptomyces syringium TaxID=76729 RepID=UPI0034327622
MNDDTESLIFTAITHAVNGDDRGATTILREIGERSDSAHMYGVCCAIAAMGAGVLVGLHGPREDGEFWRLTDLKPGALDVSGPAHTFALRFLVAHANDDADMTWALYQAAEDASDLEYVESVQELLATVACLVRGALDSDEARG